MKPVRFHFIYTFRFIKYAIILALLPFVSLLLRRDWGGLAAAFAQDALIILAVGGIAFALRWVTSCSWAGGLLEIESGLIYRHLQQYKASQIAVLEIYRPVYCRLLGASIVRFYFEGGLPVRKRQVYLSRRAAQSLCDTLLPQGAKTDASYKATGWDRLWLLLLSANIFSSIIIGFFGYRQIASLFGERMELLRDWALTGFFTLEQLFEALLPAGAAIITAILTLLTLFTLLRSFVRTTGYETRRTGTVLVQKNGFLNKLERRINLVHIGYCDVQHTPLARILRKRPVTITAGGHRGADLPLALCQDEHDPLLQELLPAYKPPSPTPLANRRCKSLWVYLWPPVALFALFLLLNLTAARILPGILPLLFIPLLLSLGSIAAQLDGYFTEGAAANIGGGIRACFTRFYTRHSVMLITGQLTLSLRENPIGALQGRATLRIKTPARKTLRIRGVGSTTALDMRFTQ